jgi:hypothetical protein
MAFKKSDSMIYVYLAASSSGTIVEVAVEEVDLRPKLQFIVEDEGDDCW